MPNTQSTPPRGLSGRAMAQGVATGFALIAAVAAEARAAEGPEVRAGVLGHNLAIWGEKNADKEDGPNVSLEVAFASPDWLNWAFAPRPYVTASINTAGDTSFLGAGLEWSAPLAAGWSIDPGLGYVVHDGETANKFPNGDPRATQFSNENVLLGSRDLFRTSFALSYRMENAWGVQLLYEHYSHGQVLGNGRNQGLDNLGVRVAYRFGAG